MIATLTNNGPDAVDHVYLDGVILTRVIAADDMKGEITRNILDANGEPKIVNGDYATITETGHVVITLNYGWRYNSFSHSFVKLPAHLLH